MKSKIDLEKDISQAEQNGCGSAVLADKNSMKRIPDFITYCTMYHLKPVIGTKFNVKMDTIKGNIVLLAKDWTGYQEICQLLSEAYTYLDEKKEPVLSVESIGEFLTDRNYREKLVIIVIEENESIICNGLLQNRTLKKEIRELRKKVKGLPSPAGESWKTAIGEFNRLKETEDVIKISLKQVPVTDDYQMEYLKKRLKKTESEKKKAAKILQQMEDGICEREKLTKMITEKTILLEKDVQEMLRKLYRVLAELGDVYIEIYNLNKRKDLISFAEEENIPYIFAKDIKKSGGIRFIPKQIGQEIEEILDQCNFDYRENDWIRIYQDGELQKIVDAGMERLKSIGKILTGEYYDRLKIETGMLKKTGTEGYLLIVYDILRMTNPKYAIENSDFNKDSLKWELDCNSEFYPLDMFYPGLLISYILGITDIDPIENDLLSDISDTAEFRTAIRRPRFMIRSDIFSVLYNRIARKFGENAVSISIASGMIDSSGYTENNIVIISNSDIRKYLPAYQKNSKWFTQCGYKEVESMGLFCIELKKQEYLDVCGECMQTADNVVNWDRIPYDQDVFKNVISKGFLNFIYTCEKYESQEEIRLSHPESISELVQVLSKGAPGGVNNEDNYVGKDSSEKSWKIDVFYRALLIYRMAYLKYYYTLSYVSAYINHFPRKVKSIVYDPICKVIGFMPPDINLSKENSYIEHESIRLGLKHIEKVSSFASMIIKERDKNGFFLSVEDLKERIGLAEEVVDALRVSGAFHNIGEPSQNSDVIVEGECKAGSIKEPLIESSYEEKNSYVVMEGIILKVEEKISKDRNMMASIRVGTSTGELYAMFFSKSYAKYSYLLKVDTEIRLYGEYIQDKYGTTFSVKEAYPVSDDTYYISRQEYDENKFSSFRRKCGCQLYLMEISGKLVDTGLSFSSEIESIQGVRKIPKI